MKDKISILLLANGYVCLGIALDWWALLLSTTLILVSDTKGTNE